MANWVGINYNRYQRVVLPTWIRQAGESSREYKFILQITDTHRNHARGIVKAGVLEVARAKADEELEKQK